MTWCDMMIAVGLASTFGCPVPADNADALPKTDKSAWEYKKPEPVVEKKEQVYFPPVVVIQKQIITKETAAPVKKQDTKLKPEQKEDSELSLEAQRIYRLRKKRTEIYTIYPENSSLSSSIPQISAEAKKLPKMKIKSSYKSPKVTSSLPVDNSRLIARDRYITGVLETGINSQLSGKGSPVVIQVSRNVFGYHGRNVLIPKGSRLVCSYKGPNKQGLSRSEIDCEAIFLAGSRAEIWQISAMGTDQQGNLGVSGEIDNRFMERYGTAFILAGISTAVRAAAQVSDGTSPDTQSGAMFQTGAEELSQRFGEITSQVLETTINLKPILKIPQGTRLQIRPKNNWYIAEVGE
ncbi:MAG: TrbI/VirB10 family protein [Alphaproteobacteria bacterium]|nr:TrbI/VirB10 family protein [Alphaproteobacteria bacterium]